MDTISLKKYIFENEKIEFVLETLGCSKIKYHNQKEYYSATQPNGDNPMGVVINNNPYLNYYSYSRNIGFNDRSDIITLVEYNKQFTFLKAVKYLHEILGLEYKWQKRPAKIKSSEKIDPLEIFKKVRSKKQVNVSDIHVLDDKLLDDYVPMLYIGWLREGIMPWSAKKFGLAYSYKRKRVIIPHRYWSTGELLGINSRTTIENNEELGIKKYLITSTYQKSLNLFGLYENYDAIQKASYVVVYEAEKSVLKRDSLNDSTGVALSGSCISDEQVRILIGLNVDIIISLDSGIPLEEIRHICEKFYNIRNVYYTYDKWGLLGEKDSVADMSNKIFNFLMKYKVKYDANEHREYLKSLEKKGD